MEKMICIPVWRYELMLKTFDQAMKELEMLSVVYRPIWTAFTIICVSWTLN